MNFFIAEASPLPILILLRPKYYINILFSNALGLHSALNAKDHVPQLYSTTYCFNVSHKFWGIFSVIPSNDLTTNPNPISASWPLCNSVYCSRPYWHLLQFPVLTPFSLIFILILSSHVCLNLPRGHFIVNFESICTILATCPVHLNFLDSVLDER